MRNGFLSYLSIARGVLLSPAKFFRGMQITEGIRHATYFALIIYYLRSAFFYYTSVQQGYFFDPRFQAIAPVNAAGAVFYALIPFFFLLILYSQSIFLFRISNFFGGTGNLEAAYKVLAYTLFLSLFQVIPYVNAVAHIYAIIILIIGIREVFNVDWISATLALFFSFIFTSALYVILMFIPAYALKLMIPTF